MKAARAAGLVLGLLLLLALADPGFASAAECTDTWIGPDAGEWQIAEYWSAAHVPTSSDVVCIPAGASVLLSTEANASLLQGEGQLTIAAGSLAVVGTAEQSNLGTLKMTGGVLKGASELRVLNSFVGEGGVMEGAGSTILGKEASGRIERVEGGFGSRLAGKRTLLVNGTLVVAGAEGKLKAEEGAQVQNPGTLEVKGPTGELILGESSELTSSGTLSVESAEGRLLTRESAALVNSGIFDVKGVKGEVRLEGTALVNFGTLELEGAESRLWADEGAVLDNSGTFVANGEREGNGLPAGPGATPVFLNTGTVVKTKGEELPTEIDYVFDNENLVKSESGTLSFRAGGESGREHTDSWVTSGLNSKIQLAIGTYDLGPVAAMEGEINFNGAQVYARELAAPAANLYVDGGKFETVSSTAPVEALYMEVNRGVINLAAGGQTRLERFRNVSGGITVGKGARFDVAASAVMEEDSVFKLEEGVEAEMERLENSEGAVVAEPNASIVAGSVNLGVGLHRFAENVDLQLGSLTIGAGETTFGKGDLVQVTNALAATGLVPFSENVTVNCGRLEVDKGGAVELGKSVNLEASGEVSLTHGGELFLAESASAATERTTIEEGLLTGPGPLETDSLFWEGGEMSGKGQTTVKETGTIWFATAVEKLDERALVLDKEFSLGDSTLMMSNGASVRNLGELDASSEATAFGPQVQVDPASKKAPHIYNFGHLEKTTGEGTTYVIAPVQNYGVVGERSGHLSFSLAEALPSSQHAEHGNESSCGDPVNCATGNFSESQTDIAVPGLGVGLGLTRTYSAQAAAAATSPGPFGYGWSSSFTDRLAIEEEGQRITVVEGDGSTVPFAKNGEGAYVSAGWSQAKLSGSAEAGYTVTLPSQVRERFSGGGRLEGVIDRNGNETALGYDEAGRLKTVADPAGRKITLAYNAEGMVESAEDPMGRLVKYGYAGGELASVTMPGELSPRWRFEYDSSHRMTKLIDGRGGETTNEYDSSNRVVSQTDPAGRTLAFEYGGFHTKVTDKATGAVTDEWFTSFNEPFKITYGFETPQASTSEFAYNEAGELTAATDGNGHTTKYGYDAEGNRTSAVNPAEGETTWTYDGAHEVLTETTPRGETTTIKRNAAGNPETVSRPAPGGGTQTTSFTYDAHGQPETMTDPLGHLWKYEHDARGDLTGETDPEGDKRTWSYDADSRLTAAVSPRGNEAGAEAAKFTTSYERDPQGRLVKLTDPLGEATEFAYDANGNVERETDANGHTTTYTYNADNQPVKVKRPNGNVLETEYDGAGQVKAQIDGLGHKTEYVRDVLEQPIEVIDPLGRKTREEYDHAGNLIGKTDPSERTTTYSYDPANRLRRVSYSDGKTPSAEFGYDKDGNLTAIADGTGETSYEYDQLDRLVHARDGHGDAVSYEYNLAGEQIGITYPNGKSVSQEFDKAGRLKSVADWLGHTTTFGYDRDSNLLTTAFPEGTGNVDEYSFDRAGRMSEVRMKKGTEVLASIGYGRDKLGQLESLTSKGLPGAESEAFGYDENSRLIKAGAEGFEYDAANDLTKAPGTTNTYDKASELEKGTGATYSYDKEGERTKATPAPGEAPIFDLSFGGAGSGAGNLSAPSATATDREGNVWVADTSHNRLQEFNGRGEFIRQVGAFGEANGQFNAPRGIAINQSTGNLYVADSKNNRIQEFNGKGEFARKWGSSGEGGAGKFAEPTGVAIDAEGHVWTVETGTFLGTAVTPHVQKFSAEGTYISQFGAKGSEPGQLSKPQGIAISEAGNIYVADTNNNRVQEFKPSGELIRAFGKEGAGNGELKKPAGLGFDPEGNLWVADTANNRLQRFSAEGTYLAQFGTAGNESGQLSEPKGLAVDSSGDVWVADTANNRVQEFSATEFLRKFGGSGSEAGNLSAPAATATDKEGNVWVADTAHNRLQEFNPKGEFIRQVGALGTENGQFNAPRGLAINQSSGNLYVADSKNNRVQELNGKGEFIRKWGSSGEGGAGKFAEPTGVAIDPEGHVWTVETGTSILGSITPHVQEFSAEGTYLSQFGAKGSAPGQLSKPQGIAISGAGNIYVADTNNNRVQEFKASGELIRAFGKEGTGNGEFKKPAALAFDVEGKLWIADTENNRVQRLSAEGEYLSQFGTAGNNNGQLSEPKGLAVDGSGNVWVADAGNNRVQEFSATEFLRAFGGTGSGAGNLSAPAATATDKEGNIWVADTAHNRLQEFNPKGEFLRQFGALGSEAGQFNAPRGLAIDSSGDIYVADSKNNRIQEFSGKGEFIRKWGSGGEGGAGKFAEPTGVAIDPEGHVWTVETGTFLFGSVTPHIQEFSSEGTYMAQFGAKGTEAGKLEKPQGIAISSAGNVYVADTANNRVQEF